MRYSIDCSAANMFKECFVGRRIAVNNKRQDTKRTDRAILQRIITMQQKVRWKNDCGRNQTKADEQTTTEPVALLEGFELGCPSLSDAPPPPPQRPLSLQLPVPSSCPLLPPGGKQNLKRGPRARSQPQQPFLLAYKGRA